MKVDHEDCQDQLCWVHRYRVHRDPPNKARFICFVSKTSSRSDLTSALSRPNQSVILAGLGVTGAKVVSCRKDREYRSTQGAGYRQETPALKIFSSFFQNIFNQNKYRGPRFTQALSLMP